MTAERISVIIPAYNAGEFIARALASVEAQTQRPDEVVVVDDGSGDDTCDQIEAFRETSALNVLVQRQANRGSSSARNRGIDAAHGELLVFLDADDVIYPRFVERTVAGLTRFPYWLACFSDRDVVNPRGDLISKDLDHPGFQAIVKQDMGDGYFELSDDALFLKLIRGSVIPMTIVCRRAAIDAIGRFDESLRFVEDRFFLLRLGKLEGRFGYVGESLGTWQRRQGGQKTSDRNALQLYQSADAGLEKLESDPAAFHLSARELAEIQAARQELAAKWIYAASHLRSSTTFALGWRLLHERRITAGCFAKAMARCAWMATHEKRDGGN